MLSRINGASNGNWTHIYCLEGSHTSLLIIVIISVTQLLPRGGYHIKSPGVAGFEPTNAAVKAPCLIHLATPHYLWTKQEEPTAIEAVLA